jgi:hypothetical protein
MKNAVFWDVSPCGSCKNRVSEECVDSIISVKIIIGLVLLQFLVTGDVVPSSLFLSTLMMEALRSSEISIFRKATRRHIPEDDILQKLEVFSALINEDPACCQLAFVVLGCSPIMRRGTCFV